MRRTALLAALVALAVLPRPASAESIPAPTLTITTTVDGTTVPNPASSGRWITEGAPGDNADLEAELVNPPGAVTTLDALWTTRTLKAYDGFPLLYHWILCSHQGLATASMPASFSYGYRLKPVGGRWGRWTTIRYSHEAGGGGSAYGRTSPFVLPKVPAKRLTLQFRVHVDLLAVGRETQSYKLQAS